MGEPAKKLDEALNESEQFLQEKEIKDSRSHLKLLKSSDLPVGQEEQLLSPSSEWVAGGFWLRGLAYLVDTFIVNATSFFIYFVITFSMNYAQLKQQNLDSVKMPTNTNLLSTVLFFLIPILISSAYYGWFYKNKGGSPGKLALGLMVVDASSREYLGWGQILLREVIAKPLSGLLLFCGYLMCLFSDEKVTLHDFISKSRVIMKRK